MKIWGIGYKFGGWDDKSRDFTANSEAVIGWDIKNAPDLYLMLREIEIGDIVYLKTCALKKGKGKELRIAKIGKVINPLKLVDENGKNALGVKWVKEFDSFLPFMLNECKSRNNVYSNTLYREYNPIIIEEILKYTN